MLNSLPEVKHSKGYLNVLVTRIMYTHLSTYTLAFGSTNQSPMTLAILTDFPKPYKPLVNLQHRISNHSKLKANPYQVPIKGHSVKTLSETRSQTLPQFITMTNSRYLGTRPTAKMKEAVSQWSQYTPAGKNCSLDWGKAGF